MTSTETVSNILFYEDSGLDLNIPDAFNPASTDYAVDTNDDSSTCSVVFDNWFVYST